MFSFLSVTLFSFSCFGVSINYAFYKEMYDMKGFWWFKLLCLVFIPGLIIIASLICARRHLLHRKRTMRPTVPEGTYPPSKAARDALKRIFKYATVVEGRLCIFSQASMIFLHGNTLVTYWWALISAYKAWKIEDLEKRTEEYLIKEALEWNSLWVILVLGVVSLAMGFRIDWILNGVLPADYTSRMEFEKTLNTVKLILLREKIFIEAFSGKTTSYALLPQSDYGYVMQGLSLKTYIQERPNHKVYYVGPGQYKELKQTSNVYSEGIIVVNNLPEDEIEIAKII